MIRIRGVNIVSRQSAGFELFLQRQVPLLKVLQALPGVDNISAGLKYGLVEVKLKGRTAEASMLRTCALNIPLQHPQLIEEGR
jgi:hypothetical protein